ncbi:hypothetical protein C2S51_009351 [Perilla frutescens var. frutescens]|nr:hypothetical protein C2S51_009351 [Perilla frutescens var. frutescens]
MIIELRLSARIHGWSHRHLSFGGRLALIKSTLATLHLHIFQGNRERYIGSAGRLFACQCLRVAWVFGGAVYEAEVLWSVLPEEGAFEKVQYQGVEEACESWHAGLEAYQSWSMPRLYALCAHFALPNGLIDSLSRISVLWGERDSMRWNLTSTGEFSLSSAWDQVRVHVDVCLQSRRTHLASRCHCCDDPHVESLEHVFFLSESARSVWAYVVSWFHTSAPHAHTVTQALRGTAASIAGSLSLFLTLFGRLSAISACWFRPGSSFLSIGWAAIRKCLLYQSLTLFRGGRGLVWDYIGSLLADFCVPLRAASSFNTEFQALLHGLRLAVQYSDHIWIEIDADSVVSVLQSGRSGSAVTRHTLTSIRMLCRG